MLAESPKRIQKGNRKPSYALDHLELYCIDFWTINDISAVPTTNLPC